MAPTDPIDLYCERTDASLWSEPLNAVGTHFLWAKLKKKPSA